MLCVGNSLIDQEAERHHASHEEEPVPAKYFFPHVRWMLGMQDYEEYLEDAGDKDAGDEETPNEKLNENRPLATETRVPKLYKPKSNSDVNEINGPEWILTGTL